MLPVAGLDISLRSTGVCILLPPEGIANPRTSTYGYDLHKDATEEMKIERILLIASEIISLLQGYEVREVGIEGYSFAERYGAYFLGEVTGVVKSKLLTSLRIVPKIIPTKTARKYMSGYGGGGKKEILSFLRGRNIAFNTDDEMDAFVTANYAWYLVNGWQGTICAEPPIYGR